MTRPGIEPESTVSAADALSTRPLILERPSSKKSYYMVIMVQLMQISLYIYIKVLNNEQSFGVWRRFFKRLRKKRILTASALLSANLYYVIIR